MNQFNIKFVELIKLLKILSKNDHYEKLNNRN